MTRLLILLLMAGQCFGAYGWRKSITVGGAVVTSGPHADYRMLVSGTDADLAVVGSGGKIQHASGYDLGYYTNSDCSTGQIAYKRIAWTSTTGAYTHHVYVNNINNSTVIYQCFGDSGISTDQQNSAGVYASAVGGAWGLDDNAANTTVADSTGNTATGTAAANTSTKTVTAKIASGLTFNGTSDGVTVSNNSTLNASTGLTIMGWVKRLRTGVADRIVFKDNSASTHYVYGVQFDSGNKLSVLVSDGTAGPSNVRFCSGSTSVTSTTVYQHVAVTYDGTTSVVYLNGASDGSGAPGTEGCASGATYTGNLTSSTGPLALGRLNYDSVSYYGNLELDFIEVENVAHTSGWVKTRYDNESNPGAFYTVGSLVSMGSTARPRRIFVQ